VDPDEWISQTEAAETRGVTRQAIARLVRRGRLRTLIIGGHTLVHRGDVVNFQPRGAGRPRTQAGDERA
jgi:excisionase family DNA binding protein